MATLISRVRRALRIGCRPAGFCVDCAHYIPSSLGAKYGKCGNAPYPNTVEGVTGEVNPRGYCHCVFVRGSWRCDFAAREDGDGDEASNADLALRDATEGRR